MSNPLMKESERLGNVRVLDSFLTLHKVASLKKRIKEITKNPQLELLDMERHNVDIVPHDSVAVPTSLLRGKQELQELAQAKTPNAAHIASASKGGWSARVRSGIGSQLVWNVYQLCNPVMQTRIRDYTSNRFMISCGAIGAYDRFLKAAPKKNRSTVPPTALEVKRAMRWCGIPNQRINALEPYTAFPSNEDGRTPISIVKGADAGYPTLGKLEDEDVLEEHRRILYDVVVALTGVDDWEEAYEILSNLEREKPWLFVHRGKAKTDVYSREKAQELFMRLYIVMPAWARMGLQMALQPLENAVSNILTGITDDPWDTARTATKLSLTGDGARQLVEVLDAQLMRDNWSASTMGDDTWFNYRSRDKLITMSLDCSNFDLTQPAEVVRPLRLAIYEQLYYIDPISAFLYRYFTTEPRLVALFTIGTYKLNNCGASGTPGQSTLNTSAMAVFLMRILRELENMKNVHNYDYESEEGMAKVVAKIGKTLGLSARIDEFYIEQYFSSGDSGNLQTECNGLKRMLSLHAFLYLGYRFTFDDCFKLHVWQDYPRALTNLIYPTRQWMDRVEFDNYEVIRLTGTLLNLGVQPRTLSLKQDDDRSKYVAVGTAEWRDTTTKVIALDLISYMVMYMTAVANKTLKEPEALVDTGAATMLSPFVGVTFTANLTGVLSALSGLQKLWTGSDIGPIRNIAAASSHHEIASVDRGRPSVEAMVHFHAVNHIRLSEFGVTIASWPELLSNAPLMFEFMSKMTHVKITECEKCTSGFITREAYVHSDEFFEDSTAGLAAPIYHVSKVSPKLTHDRFKAIHHENATCVRHWYTKDPRKHFGKMPPQFSSTVPRLATLAAISVRRVRKAGVRYQGQDQYDYMEDDISSSLERESSIEGDYSYVVDPDDDRHSLQQEWDDAMFEEYGWSKRHMFADDPDALADYLYEQEFDEDADQDVGGWLHRRPDPLGADFEVTRQL